MTDREATKPKLGPVAFYTLGPGFPRLVRVLFLFLVFWFLLPIPGTPRTLLRVAEPAEIVGHAALDVAVTASFVVPCAKAGPGAVLNCEQERIGVAPGAALRLYRYESGKYALAGEATTDGGGRASFVELVPGAYWLLADAPGFGRKSRQVVMRTGRRHVDVALLPAAKLVVEVVDEKETPLAGVTVLVNTRDPLPFGGLTGADGKLLLDRLGAAPWEVHAQAPGYEVAVQKKVFGDTRLVLRRLSGIIAQVVDAEGKGVAGARVLVAGLSVYPPRRADTDAKGFAELRGLGHGSFDLKASHGGRVSSTLTSVQLGPGELRRVTLTLGAGRSVAIQVVEDGTDPPVPIPDADVVLVESGISPFPLFGRSGADGRITLGPISPGPAAVAASAEGFISRNAVPLPEDPAAPLLVRLFRGGTLVGKVVDHDDRPIAGASLEVVGMDLDGLPIAETPSAAAFRRGHFAWALQGPAPLIPVGELGVTVGPIPAIPNADPFGPDAQELAGGFRGQLQIDAPRGWQSDFDGSFTLHPVPPGRVRVLARHPSFVEGVSAVVELLPGGKAEVKIVLESGAAIEGRVQDESGLPVAGARVDVVAIQGSVQRSVFTATDGTFAFAALPTQVMISVARPEDPYRMVLRREISLAAGETREIEFTLPEPRPGITVVVEATDARSVDAVQVTLLSLEPLVPLRQTRFTDQLGEVQFDDALGLHASLELRAPGYSPYAKTFPKLPERVEITLEKGVRVTGVVQFERGFRTLAGASVVLLTKGQRYHSETSEQGVFQFDDIPPGPSKLTIRHPAYAPLDVDVVVKDTGRADRPFEIDPIVLEEAGSISGVVVDGNGAPVRGARVAVGIVPSYLPATGDLPAGMVRTDAQGSFFLPHVQPGHVELEAYLPDVGRGVASGVEVEAGEDTEGIRIVLEPVQEATNTPAGGGGGVAVTLGEHDTDEGTDVVVVHVAEGSEAERSGVQPGDVVKAVDGAATSSMGEARGRLNGKIGQDVVLTVSRGGREVRLRIRRERVQR